MKFTCATSSCAGNFLHLNVSLRNGIIHTDLYIKPTDVHQYLHYQFSYPLHIKCYGTYLIDSTTAFFSLFIWPQFLMTGLLYNPSIFVIFSELGWGPLQLTTVRSFEKIFGSLPVINCRKKLHHTCFHTCFQGSVIRLWYLFMLVISKLTVLGYVLSYVLPFSKYLYIG